VARRAAPSLSPSGQQAQVRHGDAFGTALLDWVRGGRRCELIERDDGHTEDGAGPAGYLTPLRGWPAGQRAAIRHVRGRVADLGCGAGRVTLVLQERGVDVVGIDASPLALRAARARGVRVTRRGTLEALGSQLGDLDTVVLFGNNFGIFATPDNATRTLASWARRASPGTRILAESTSPYGGGAPVIDRRYYWRNRERGLPPGRTRYRIRYGQLVGPWDTWLFVSQKELREIVAGTGWRLVDVFGAGAAEPYVAMLERPRSRLPVPRR
jgi:SAM-dependent methyltransferase